MNPQEHFEAARANMQLSQVLKSCQNQILHEKRSSFTNGMLVAAFILCGVIGGFEVLGALHFFGGCK